MSKRHVHANIQTYVLSDQVLHHRVRSLENINIDLEYRLEQQAKQTMQAEHEYTEIDRSWQAKYAEMQKVDNL